MRTTRLIAAALATTALVAGGTTAAVAAVTAHGGSDRAATVAPRAPAPAHAVSPTVSPAAATSPKHTLAGTYFDEGYSGAALASGFGVVGNTITIKCSTKCVVEGDQNVQQRSTVASNLTALSLRIDGTDSSGPYLGYAPTATYGASAWTVTSGVLAAGTHTLQTALYAASGTTAYNYSDVYRVYIP